jgi:hypothetical protein
MPTCWLVLKAICRSLQLQCESALGDPKLVSECNWAQSVLPILHSHRLLQATKSAHMRVSASLLLAENAVLVAKDSSNRWLGKAWLGLPGRCSGSSLAGSVMPRAVAAISGRLLDIRRC